MLRLYEPVNFDSSVWQYCTPRLGRLQSSATRAAITTYTNTSWGATFASYLQISEYNHLLRRKTQSRSIEKTRTRDQGEVERHLSIYQQYVLDSYYDLDQQYEL